MDDLGNLIPLTSAIETACTQLEYLSGYEQLEALYYEAHCQKWVLHFKITLSLRSSKIIPSVTQWYALIDPQYPRGSIQLYPDQDRGIKETFPHQSNNNIHERFPWRTGAICTTWDTNTLDRLSDNEEQMTEEVRLYWHITRLQQWLFDASEDKLVRPGDYLELPFVNTLNVSKKIIIYSEEREDLDSWSESESESGYLIFEKNDIYIDSLFITHFLNHQYKPVKENKWGDIVDFKKNEKSIFGVWILLDFKPIIKPWSYPKTFEELETICLENGLNLWEKVYSLMNVFRNQEENFLLIGFPIPEIIGETNQIVKWIAYQVPKLTRKVKKTKGFRKSKSYYWQMDRLNVLKPSRFLQNVHTRNLSKETILSRGSLHKNVQQDKVFLLGAGALGSAIGELLSRTGISQITVCDSDIFATGNLVRHSLGVEAIGGYKAQFLAKKWKSNGIHVKTMAIPKSFPELSEDEIDYMESHQIIIDTTGSDEVIKNLNIFKWNSPKRFVSLSLGFGAKRMFMMLCNKHPFPKQQFIYYMQPWLLLERQENENAKLPKDGIGCYNPLFPARLDDVWIMASIALKEIEKWRLDPLHKNLFIVFEQNNDQDMYQGVSLKQREEFT